MAADERTRRARCRELMQARGTAALALGATTGRRLDLLSEAVVPVLLVPTAAPAPPPRLRTVLVPLDGTRPASRAVAQVLAQLERAGLELEPVHVFDETSVPAFWDPAHSVDPGPRSSSPAPSRRPAPAAAAG